MNSLTVSEEAVVEEPGFPEDQESAIILDNIGVRYRVSPERIFTFKEYMIRRVQGKVRIQDFWALKDFTLNIRRGEVFGIIGPNGAGKSTLLKIIARVLKPTTGRVIVKGRVAPLLEFGAAFHPDLTGRENIFLNGALLGFSHQEMVEKFEGIVDFAELWDFIDAPMRTYSSGMWARLGFAVATDVEPDILIIDEILSVGDEAFQRKSFARIRAFYERGATILLVSHTMDTIRAMCHQAVWLDHGVMKAVGEVENVIMAYRKGQPE
ncbi:MAG TPA: ABC transporter ATP-binding protein [Anaerolineales bacterium]|nr:ABC transporter ATP-binding protein [Anaerolineales bacterium]